MIESDNHPLAENTFLLRNLDDTENYERSLTPAPFPYPVENPNYATGKNYLIDRDNKNIFFASTPEVRV